MKKSVIILMLGATLSVASGIFGYAQPKTTPTETIILYPEGQDACMNTTASMTPAGSNGITDPESIDRNGIIRNIGDKARVDIYLPETGNGQLVVICPGGGYECVSSYNEGAYVAEWLLSHGIAAAVVMYRMPKGHSTLPLADVQNVIRYCRDKSSLWKIRTIGVMGFSAGGHLAACASNLFADDVTRPDFSILIYPVISMDKSITHMGSRNSLIGNDENVAHLYSMEKRVSTKTPPTFIAHCSDDKGVPVSNSLAYYSELVRNNVPAEMHIYPTGGHGWGFPESDKATDKIGYARDEFKQALVRWLESVR